MFNISKFNRILKKNIILMLVLVLLGAVGNVGRLVLGSSTTVTSTSLFMYDYSHLLQGVENYSGLNDLQYRKIADYVAIAKSTTFKNEVGLTDQSKVGIKFEFLRDSHVAQMTVTGSSKEEVEKYDKKAQETIEKIANSLYGDNLKFVGDPVIKTSETNLSAYVKDAVLGGIVGLVVALGYVTVRYKVEKDDSEVKA